jgi:hypothetical protein|tara:strand:- start:89 stop:430 length:342 start_codon:yes stop_codon:yes gene_type:complete
MAKVIITSSLEKAIHKRFRHDSIRIFKLMLDLESFPKKGKVVGVVGGVVIKELKYNVYRFYFITDGYKVKFLRDDELSDLLIKFVRMSAKDDQKEVIAQIKQVLRSLGSEGFS